MGSGAKKAHSSSSRAAAADCSRSRSNDERQVAATGTG